MAVATKDKDMGDFLTELWSSSGDQPVVQVAVLSGLLFLGLGSVISFLSVIGFSEAIKAHKWLVLVITIAGSVVVAIGSLLWSGIWVVAAVILVVGVPMRLALRSQRFKEFAQRNYVRLMTKLRDLGRWLSNYWQWMFALLLPPGVVIAGFLWLPRALWPLILVMLGLALSNAFFTLWLRRGKEKSIEIFRDDFSTLDNWEKDGDWSIVHYNDARVLRVTDSGVGGIAKPCLSWADYVFEFDTKIEKDYSGWLVRAKDLDNYVLLQCRLDQIRLCLKANGKYYDLDWSRRKATPLSQDLAVNVWYHVKIEVRRAHADITISEGNIAGEMRIAGLPPLGHPEKTVDYSEGSVGFREATDECALFRNVRVKRLR